MEHKPNPSPWHVIEQGVLLCSDEKGFCKLHRTSLPRIVEKIQALIKKDFKSSGFMGEAHEIALDALADVFPIVGKKGLSLEGKNGFEAYVLKSARNRLLRKSKTRKEVLLDIERVVIATGAHSALKRERLLEQRRKKVMEVFEDCFKRNSDMKQVVYRSVVNGEDHKDIAKALDTNAENSRQLKKRGLEKLRKAFEKLTDPPWDDGFMDDMPLEKQLYFNRDILSLCERNSNALTLNQWTNSTYCMKNIEKPDRISIASEKTLDRKPSGNRRRRKSTSPHTGISDERFESLLELLREGFHGYVASKDKP